MSTSNLMPIHKAANRFLISLVVGIVVFFICPNSLNLLETLSVSWVAFAAVYLAIDWWIIAKSSNSFVQKHAHVEDGSRLYVLLMLVLASVASILMVSFLIFKKDETNFSPAIFIIITLSGLLLTWFLIHTIFSFHYARMYYQLPQVLPLKFPEQDVPDYTDFAYFSFNIGCSFQTSDVVITGSKIRKTVLLHTILSFILNTVLVALTINIVASMR